MSDPPRIDSTKWTGEMPPPRYQIPYGGPGAKADPRLIHIVLSVVAVWLLFLLGRPLLWLISGAPLVILPGADWFTTLAGLCAGLIAALIAVRRKTGRGWTTFILSSGLASFTVLESRYLYDRNFAVEAGAARYFVSSVKMPGWSRRRPKFLPYIEAVDGYGRQRTLIAPQSWARRLVPGDSCLIAHIWRGRFGFEFLDAEIQSADDGTGSFMVAAENRTDASRVKPELLILSNVRDLPIPASRDI